MDVFTNFRIIGQQTKIGIDFGIHCMIVACT
ncbi:Uncharacterised protein [Klebsiella pneumoniae]|nr:Uncharacterised protein [Klebsiella pneumoniae]